MTAFASWLIFAAALAVLALKGGAGFYSRPLFETAVAIALLAVAIGMGRRFRRPSLWWIALVFLPVALVGVAQVAPIGWQHPWTAEDGRLLATTTGAWSIDSEASWRVVSWTVALAGLALILQCHFRGERANVLAKALVIVATAHAASGIVLALCGADWPSPMSGFKVRGSFVYYNHAAAFWACCLPLAILVARRATESEEAKPIGWWFAVGILALSVVLSASRGGILVAAAINLPLAWRVLPRRRRAWWFTGLCAGMAAYLAIIGLREIGDKFSALMGPDGVTLNGRVTIWKESLPVIADAGPLGSGGGTAEQAFWRAGDTSFSGRTVNHLHSDPLEWVLEFGWVGVALIAAGLLALAWRLRPPRGGPFDRVLYWGGTLGIAHLCLHSCADFIWNRESIAIAAVVLLVLICEGRSDHRDRPTVRSGWVRLACVLLAVVLAAITPRSWRQDIEGKLAHDAGEFMQSRKQSGLPTNGVVVDSLLAAEPTTAVLAVAQARAALDLQERSAERSTRIDQARLALRRAGELAPASVGAWVERVRLVTAELRLSATQAPPHPELPASISRILVWAPAWPYAQVHVLDVIRRVGLGTLPPDRLEALVRRLLSLDQRQPAWFFRFAQQVVGRAELSVLVAAQDAGHLSRPQLTSSGLWWLSQYADSQAWWSSYVQLIPPWKILDPYRAVLRPLLGARLPLHVAGSGEDLRSQAEQLRDADLPMPQELESALRSAGPPWSAWADPIDLADPETRTRLAQSLSADLFRGWARGWFDRVHAADSAFAGNTTILNHESDPALVASVLARGVIRTSAERERLEQLLSSRVRLQWTKLGEGCWWSWVWIASDGETQTVSRSDHWMGLVVDGAWKDWMRGPIVIAGLPRGLHRIALIDAP